MDMLAATLLGKKKKVIDERGQCLGLELELLYFLHMYKVIWILGIHTHCYHRRLRGWRNGGILD